jgi:hypothetical protein
MDTVPEGFISRRDAAIAAVIAVFFGAGVALFAVGWFQVVFNEQGNPADWLAAIGTWVIGYGAWGVAREAHLHRKQELYETERRDRNAIRTRLMDMRFRVATATGVRGGLKRLLESETPVNFVTTKAVIQVGDDSLSELQWPESDRRCLDEHALRALASLTSEVSTFRSTVLLFAELVGSDRETFDARSHPVFETVLEYAENMELAAAEFVSECDRIHRATPK